MPSASGTPPGEWTARSPSLVVTIVTALIVVFTAAFLDRSPPRPTDAETAFAHTEATPVVVATSSVAPRLSPPPPRPPVPPEPAAAAAAVPLSDRERALLESLDPDLFAALPPRAGAWEEGAHPPCFVDDASKRRRCLPDYHVVGAWQSGGQAFNAKLGLHPDVREGAKPHFWNEPDKPMNAYLDLFAARAEETDDAVQITRVGDASPGVLANTWTESQRMHRLFKDAVAACWQACQNLPDTFNSGNASGSDEHTPTPRRLCVDGDANKSAPGCIERAARIDAVVNGSASDFFESAFPENALSSESLPLRSTPLSVPHLMRHAYGAKSVKIIALVRSPLARLRAAFAHYAHYAKEFGEGEDGFVKFVDFFIDKFERCETEEKEKRTKKETLPDDAIGHTRSFTPRTTCAFHFEALGPDFEKVFYHCDQLIKTMYGTFANGWVDAFGVMNVLFLRTEDAFSESAVVRKRALNRAIRFLGLRVPTDDVVSKMDSCDEASGCAKTTVFEEDARLARLDFGDGAAATRSETRKKIDAFFEPELDTLARLFGDDDEATSWAAWGRGDSYR